MPLHERKEHTQRHYTDEGVRADKLIKSNEITWIFEGNSFIPCGKIKNNKKFSIFTDHLGTPTQLYDKAGEQVWERQLDANGKVIKGDNDSCSLYPLTRR